MSSQQLYAAIDVGGTKIAAALVDAGGTLLTRTELPTPPKGSGGEEVMATVGRLVDTLAEDARWADVAGVGIGSAGPVDPTRGTVSPVNIPGWRDFPLVSRVRRLDPIAGTKVVLVGDGSAMAAGEHWRGAAKGYDNALCLVVSTGVGAGLILDGALRTGPSGNAGHLGHISVDVEGEDCPCGSRGCLETIASGTSIARWAVQNGWRARPDNVVYTNSGPTPTLTSAPSRPSAATTTTDNSAATAASASARTGAPASAADTSTSARTGDSASAAVESAFSARTGGLASATITTGVTVAATITAADIAASARAGDPIALAAFERAGRALAAGIAGTAMLVDIRAAVIGGGVAKAGEVLFDPLRRHLDRYASLPFTRDLDILPAQLGGDAGLIGAAAAALTHPATR